MTPAAAERDGQLVYPAPADPAAASRARPSAAPAAVAAGGGGGGGGGVTMQRLRHREVPLHHRDCARCDRPQRRHVAARGVILHQLDRLLVRLICACW